MMLGRLAIASLMFFPSSQHLFIFGLLKSLSRCAATVKLGSYLRP